MRAVFVCPASGVPPETCPCSEDVDGAVRDVQVLDIPDVPHDQSVDNGPPDTGAVDAGRDVPVVDAGRCPSGPVGECDGRNVSLVTGERDIDGRVRFCGACNVTCAAGEVCASCRCGR